MTLNETVRQKVAEWRPPGEGRTSLAIPDEGNGWSAAITADRWDDLSCLLWEVVVQSHTKRAGMSLPSWAQQIAQRVSGLMETLKVVEIDAQRNEALIRSEDPHAKGDQVAFYEVLLHGTHKAIVRRFQAFRQLNQRRQQVVFALTHEALAKLIADLAGEN
jgi:hypothetical protein